MANITIEVEAIPEGRSLPEKVILRYVDDRTGSCLYNTEWQVLVDKKSVFNVSRQMNKVEFSNTSEGFYYKYPLVGVIPGGIPDGKTYHFVFQYVGGKTRTKRK